MAVVATPPIAFIVSVVALIRKSGPVAAVVGLLISGLMMAFVFGLFGLITHLCR